MDLSIIIVNWKSKDYLQKCLASVWAETRGIQFEIVVIDAASYDGCDRMLREHFPAVRFIQSEKNLGFAGANNAAYAVSKGEFLLFLNPDTELCGPAINTLFDQVRRLPDAGVVGAKLLNSDGTVQTSCIQSIPTILNQVLDSEALRAKWPKSTLWGMAPLFNDSGVPDEVEAISGACMMLPRTVFEKVGRFSEDYFMYSEDIDLSYKVRCVGRKNFYVSSATVVHHGGTSTQQAVSNFSVVMMREAVWRFMCKTRGRAYAGVYRGAMLGCALLRLVFLGLIFPIQQLRQRRSGWNASFAKWLAILRWSLGCEGWLRDYR